MYRLIPRYVPSALDALKVLRSFFGDLVLEQKNEQGSTTFGVVVKLYSHVQMLGVPPNSRHYPPSHSLYINPLAINFHFIHPNNRHTTYPNGSVVDLFIGSSRGAKSREDCPASIACTLQFIQSPSGIIIPNTTLKPRQRRLMDDIKPLLEDLIPMS